MKRHTIFTCVLLLFIFASGAAAQYGTEKKIAVAENAVKENDSSTGSKNGKEFRHVIRNEISPGENILNISMVYSAQWTYYLLFQWETIQEHGSFKNWYSNMYQPHFDHDSYNYNLIFHTLAGNYYYLFFRSRGHTKVGALWWSALSQLLFEFTVETITEPPSFQDMYQTPILGAVLGITLEYLSCQLLSTDYTLLHILGYILNPFTAFPVSSYKTIGGPIITANHYGYSLVFRF